MAVVRSILLLLLTAVSSAMAQEPYLLEAAALDGGGALWAFHRASAGEVNRFDGKKWETLPPPFPDYDLVTPVAASILSDGAVACVWWLNEHRFAVTRHLGRESRVLGALEGKLPNNGSRSAPFADSHGRLWIVGPFPEIYRADQHGLVLAHEITPEELESPGAARREYNETHAVEDGKGRVWVWSEAGNPQAARLHGALVFTGDKVERRDPCATLKEGARILALARADEQHLWMAVADDGIYRVDIDTLALERQWPPLQNALCRVHDLFVDGDALYAVDWATAGNSLWRGRKGEWEQIIPRLETGTNPWHPRVWCAVKEGLLVGAYGAGPWFVPRQGPAAQLSWRDNFPLVDVRAFLPLPGGDFFALGINSRIFRGPLRFPPTGEDNLRVQNLGTERGWTVDAAGRPWVASPDAPGTIREWVGGQWVAHPVPPGTAKDGSPKPRSLLPQLRADTAGRLWVDYSSWQNGVGVFDTHSGQWQVFAGLEDVYLAMREQPPHYVEAPDETPDAFDPQYSADRRRIAYRDNDIHYYDGSAWQRWKRQQITGKKESDIALGPPWFDAQGRLCVNTRPGTTWRRGDEGQWTQTAFESHFPRDIWSEGGAVSPGPVTPPEGCVTNHPDSIVRDNVGTYWLSWHQELYRCIPGRCVRVFAPNEPNPFHVEHQLRRAFVDADGNAFLLTAAYTMETFLIHAKPPLHTTVTVELVGADGVRARLHTDPAQAVQFRWQLDDGPNQTTDRDVLTLDGLSNGAHALKVSAVNSDLQPEAEPAVAKFEITVDADRQLAALIAGLSDADYEKRKAAVTALERQPNRAIPALRKARETADGDTAWWIDAALEQATQSKNAASPPSEKSP